MVDPNGEEVWIYYGDNQKAEYKNGKLYNSDGGKYRGKDAFVDAVLSILNKINSTENGKEMIKSLVNSKDDFDFTNTSVKDGKGNVISKTAQFESYKNGGGEIHANFFMDKSVNEGQKVDTTAHELFHGYQSQRGEQPSVNKEVGAYLFGRSIAVSLGYPTSGFGSFSKEGKAYEKAMSGLMFESTRKFDLKLYNQALKNSRRERLPTLVDYIIDIKFFPIKIALPLKSFFH